MAWSTSKYTISNRNGQTTAKDHKKILGAPAGLKIVTFQTWSWSSQRCAQHWGASLKVFTLSLNSKLQYSYLYYRHASKEHRSSLSVSSQVRDSTLSSWTLKNIARYKFGYSPYIPSLSPGENVYFLWHLLTQWAHWRFTRFVDCPLPKASFVNSWGDSLIFTGQSLGMIWIDHETKPEPVITMIAFKMPLIQNHSKIQIPLICRTLNLLRF